MSDIWNKTMDADVANRNGDINWPDGFDPASAELFAHNESVIHASAEKVWQHITAATAWPE